MVALSVFILFIRLSIRDPFKIKAGLSLRNKLFTFSMGKINHFIVNLHTYRDACNYAAMLTTIFVNKATGCYWTSMSNNGMFSYYPKNITKGPRKKKGPIETVFSFNLPMGPFFAFFP